MPRSSKQFKLVPAEVPLRRGRGAGVYAQVVADFVASGHDSALVEMVGRKPPALALGLRKAVAATGAAVDVVGRGGQVYLRRV